MLVGDDGVVVEGVDPPGDDRPELTVELVVPVVTEVPALVDVVEPVGRVEPGRAPGPGDGTGAGAGVGPGPGDPPPAAGPPPAVEPVVDPGACPDGMALGLTMLRICR